MLGIWLNKRLTNFTKIRKMQLVNQILSTSHRKIITVTCVGDWLDKRCNYI